jgi:hypothetical protein
MNSMSLTDGTSARQPDLATPPAPGIILDFEEGKQRISQPRIETPASGQPEEPPAVDDLEYCSCGAPAERYAPDSTPYCAAHYPAGADDDFETQPRMATPSRLVLPSKPNHSSPAVVPDTAMQLVQNDGFWLERRAMKDAPMWAPYQYEGILYGEGRTPEKRRDDWQQKLKALDPKRLRLFRQWREQEDAAKSDREQKGQKHE